MSLRARLAILAVALVAIGLAVAGFATHRFLSDFLVDRVDAQLESARPFALGAVLGPDLGPGPGSGPGGFTLPYGTYAAVFDDEGEELGSVSVPDQTNVSPPDLSGSLPTDERAVHLTAIAEDGSLTYRALVTPIDAVPGTDQAVTLVVAVPLSDVAATLRQLVIVELLVGIAVLVLVGALALWLVRIGLRPLEGIGVTAGAIAAGDLTQRVEPADERTEVGRLGLSLNAMLVQIEAAFEERRASEARLRRFVADASHELRTPLTSIRGYAELFRRGAGSRPEDLEKSMKRIEAEASRMGVLVDDLLLLARLDQGRPLGRESVDLDGVLVEGTEAAQAIEPDRSIDLVVEEEIRVLGDRDRLRQVVDNLLDNVRVHTPPEAPVHVNLSRRGNEAVLTVRDEGPGLSPESRDRVFERFYRDDPARSRRTGGGAGLGLSIVAAIVEAHGGSVEAAIVEGGGTMLEVRLPVLAKGSPANESPDEEVGDIAGEGPPTSQI